MRCASHSYSATAMGPWFASYHMAARLRTQDHDGRIVDLRVCCTGHSLRDHAAEKAHKVIRANRINTPSSSPSGLDAFFESIKSTLCRKVHPSGALMI
jgi:hypothetical protein